MRSRPQVALSLLTWILLLNNCKVQASDGCGLENWKCGDICIPQSKTCHCGGDKIQFNETLQNEDWCCSEKPCTELGVWEITFDEYGDQSPLNGFGWSEGANCSSGKALLLMQPCEGKCNDNREIDWLQDFRSYIPCPPTTENAPVSQCIRQGEESDNQFQCLNRADENPFSPQGITRSSTLDLSTILTNCTLSSGPLKGFPGLACPNTFLPQIGYDSMSECAPYFFWCRKDIPIYCEYGSIDFVATDPQVCKNASFWQQHPTCGSPDFKRCNGTGKCIESDSEQKCDDDLADQPYLNPADKIIDLDNLIPQCHVDGLPG